MYAKPAGMRAYTKIVVLTLTVLMGPAIGKAYAVTIRDLVELSKEGVSDAVLVALIETDGSRFRLTPDDIRSVRAQGLSDAVIVAMIRTRPAAAPSRDGVVAEMPAEPAEPAPLPVAIAPVAPAPVVVQTPPVTVSQTVVQRVEVERSRPQPEAVYVPVYVPVRVKPVEEKKPEPVYWGWGGKRRPDAWKEPVIK